MEINKHNKVFSGRYSDQEINKRLLAWSKGNKSPRGKVKQRLAQLEYNRIALDVLAWNESYSPD